MRLTSALGAFALLLLPIQLAERMAEVHAATVVPEPTWVVKGRVSPHSTLGGLLDHVLPPASIDGLVQAARPVYNLARISAGQPFGLALGPDGLVAAFTYGIDELRTLRVRRMGDRLKAEILTRTYDTELATVSGTIESSLFGAVAEAGEHDQLALDLADIFAWDVDFNTELQKGDSFRVAVEKLSLGGRFSRYGRILAAQLLRGDRVLRAVRFEAGRGPGYYAPDGTPLRKAFLRSPLRFTRISSGFTAARMHPILGRITTHYGVDYAAPEGTPVGASADGVVTLAGWLDGYGNTVKLRHANGFETLYGHLSRVQVRVGQRVEQGATIGAVGATGLATGPHLDYRLARNGAFVNPLTAQLPPAEPLAPEERVVFEAARDAQLVHLGPAPRPATRAADAGPAEASRKPIRRTRR
jgi:murein DD-endopeptidase MepM/ murein hydrolase activator NlpD